MRKNDGRQREYSEQRFSRGGGGRGGGGKGHLFYCAFVFSVFISLFSLCGGKYKKFFWLSCKKEERDEKSEKSACVFSLRANFFSSDDEKRARNEKKANEKKAFEDRSNTTTCHRKNLSSPFVLFLKTHRKRRSGLISRARLFWTPSGEEVHRVERKERRDLGERESASEEI